MTPNSQSTSGERPPTWLQWHMPTVRVGPLNVVLVESYEPLSGRDPQIVSNVLRHLLGLDVAESLEPLTGNAPRFIAPRPFDLVLFPEGMLPLSQLTRLADFVESSRAALGLIHVGLRGRRKQTFLIPTDEILDAIAKLRVDVEGIAVEDLDAFTGWLATRGAGNWSLGAFLGRDRDQRLRVCLHAKINPSKYESSAILEHDITCGDVAWVVSLLPEDGTASPLHVQPLICSDLLDARPLDLVRSAVDRRQVPFGMVGAIDVVSVTSCSPTASTRWRDDFTNNVRGAAQGRGVTTHRQAAVFLANYTYFPAGKSKGLAGYSGAFLPRYVSGPHPEIHRLGFLRVPSEQRDYVKGLDPNADYQWHPLDAVERQLKAASTSKVLPREAWPPYAWLTEGTLSMLKRPANGKRPTARLMRFSAEVPPRACKSVEQPLHGIHVQPID